MKEQLVIVSRDELLRTPFVHRFLAGVMAHMSAKGFAIVLHAPDDRDALRNGFVAAYADALPCPSAVRIEPYSRARPFDARSTVLWLSPVDLALWRVRQSGRPGIGLTHMVWYQGVVPEESWERNHSVSRYFVLRLLERFGVRLATRTIVPSMEMARLIAKRCDIQTDRIAVVPNLLVSAGGNLHLAAPTGPLTVGYSGSLGKGFEHQCFPETCGLVRRLQDAENIEFHVLTPQGSEAWRIAKDCGVRQVEIDQVPANRLTERISRFDCGLLLRKPRLLNRVSFPLKLLDYLCAGVPMITTEPVAAQARSVHSRAARTVSLSADGDDITGILEWLHGVRAEGVALRFMLSDAVRRNWTWESRPDVLNDVFGPLPNR